MEDVKILELVDYVNKNLLQGLSTATIEKKMKVGKDTIRKKLNRNNYFFNKELNQYIEEDKEPVKNNSNPIAPQQKQKEIIIEKKLSIEEENLTTNEIKILRDIIKEYKAKEHEEIALDLDGEIVVRSIRSYKKVLDSFSRYCKKRDLNQKDIFAKALISYMQNN